MESIERTYTLTLRRPTRRVLIVAGVIAVLGALALAAFLWLRSYAPLEWDGNGGFGPDTHSPGYVKNVEPFEGSDGKTVYVVQAGSFTFGFDLHNKGPLPVRLDGVGSGETKPFALSAVGYGPGTGGDYLHQTQPLPFTFHADGYRYLVLRLRSSCADYAHGSSVTLSRVPLRYSYLGVFHRTAWVELPAAVTLRC